MAKQNAPVQTPRSPTVEGGFGRDEVRAGALVEFSSDIITVLDAQGRVIYSSPAATRLLGYPLGFMRRRSAFELVHPDDLERVASQFLAELASPGPGEPVEFRMRHADGSWRHVEAVGSNWLDDPTVRGVVINARDVTERVHTEEELRASEERFRGAFEHAPIGMAIVDEAARLVRCNRALADMLGYAPESLIGMTVRDVTHPEDWAESREKVQAIFSGELSGYQIEKRYVHADGHTVWVSLSVSAMRDRDGKTRYAIGHVQDVTERKALDALLAHQARHDPLTGLLNRGEFLDRLRLAQDREAPDSKVAVLFLDLDHFKVINDSLGHDAGDQLLVVIAERLRQTLRPRDSVARLGGDEFTIVFRDIRQPGAAMRLAERVLREVSRPIHLPADEVFLTASIGIALSTGKRQEPETLLRDADAAMYAAKQHGRARAEFFEPDLLDRSLDQLHTNAALRHGLERHEFAVHYQPIVELATGTVTGFEALLRWQHPERGLIPPGEFISYAEDTGLIVPIGSWVLEEACGQLARWRALEKGQRLTISVNLSPRQLLEPSLPATIARILKSTKVPAHALWLEITETTLMCDTEAVTDALQTLRTRGVHFSIDDFGTGYSSLSHLKGLPIEALKIDQTFIDGLGHEPEDTAIVTGVIQLATALGLNTTAEGVETPHQLDHLRSLGCTNAQGNYLAEAQPPSRAPTLPMQPTGRRVGTPPSRT